jgi:hypothetical protein
MEKWNNDFKGATLMGRNFIGISDEGKLLIEDRDIAPFVFSFDPNKKTVIKQLGLRLQQTCQLSADLSFRMKDNRLVYTGNPNDLYEARHKLQDYLNKHIKEPILVNLSTPTILTKETLQKNYTPLQGLALGLIYRMECERQGTDTIVLGEYMVSLPLSSLNLLLEHFKIPYHFDYLGDKVDNTDCMLVIARGFGSMFGEPAIEKSFHTDLAIAQERLQTIGLREALGKKETQICRQTVPPSVVQERMKAKL